MSLFPAYSAKTQENQDELPTTTTKWLENDSFALSTQIVQNVQKQQNTIEISSTSSSSSATNSSNEDCELITEEISTKKSKKKHKKHKKHKKYKRDEKDEKEQQLKLDFNGEEEYYVDKKPSKQYFTIRTLHKPACPRYHIHFNTFGYNNNRNINKNIKRYYRIIKKQSDDMQQAEAMHENDYTLKLGKLNKKIAEKPQELQNWLDLIDLQQFNPYKWSNLLLAEKKLELIARALTHHQYNEKFYNIYIDIVNATYPSFEITSLLDSLLHKDPNSYTLWSAQIMTTQGSMARCVVPDVLQLYERCMKKMYKVHKQTNDIIIDTDEIILRLFNNCALFLRQAGLHEQFIALLKLALELNISTDKFNHFQSDGSEQTTLIEYEEIILQSGLPMNELWLRIEKLRQSFNFLPYPLNAECSDPQRIVLNEDICHFIYPLRTTERSFYLLLLILHHLKLPFIQLDTLSIKFWSRQKDVNHGTDAIEYTLAAYLRRSFALPQQHIDEYLLSLFELNREMAVPPTFLNNTIGHELYSRCLTQLLISCAEVYEAVDERRRLIFLLLLCRFERLQLMLQKFSKKLNSDYIKVGRNRFKALLKQKLNRNALNLYTEFAIYEYEAMEQNNEGLCNLFDSLIASNSTDQNLSSDLCYLYCIYVEILIGKGLHENALKVLVNYALDGDIKVQTTIGGTKKLSAMQKLIEKCDNVVGIERDVTIMILEQYLLPDYTTSLIKLRVYMQYLLGHKLQAIEYIEKLLKTFLLDSDRHSFLRENIQELYIVLMQLSDINTSISPKLLSDKLFIALNEYPCNLLILQNCCMITSIPWFKIRSNILSSNTSINAIIFLIAAARYRYIQMPDKSLEYISIKLLEYDNDYNEKIVQNRILNIFQTIAKKITTTQKQITNNLNKYENLRRNALFWRLYLRCISSEHTSFDVSKRCLLTALDECPWNKALYLDGATYVPQELSSLQDLIIEKQLRIYALPEELQILREEN